MPYRAVLGAALTAAVLTTTALAASAADPAEKSKALFATTDPAFATGLRVSACLEGHQSLDSAMITGEVLRPDESPEAGCVTVALPDPPASTARTTDHPEVWDPGRVILGTVKIDQLPQQLVTGWHVSTGERNDDQNECDSILDNELGKTEYVIHIHRLSAEASSCLAMQSLPILVG